jgi:hypothetical protein
MLVIKFIFIRHCTSKRSYFRNLYLWETNNMHQEEYYNTNVCLPYRRCILITQIHTMFNQPIGIMNTFECPFEYMDDSGMHLFQSHMEFHRTYERCHNYDTIFRCHNRKHLTTLKWHFHNMFIWEYKLHFQQEMG